MSFSTNFSLIIFIASSLLFEATLGEIVCEELPKNVCSYSISSSGKRCLLENKDGEVEYECKTSDVVVQRIVEHIETDECVDACGLDRNTVGLSSDSLLEPHLTARLCSPHCYYKCPNIVDLYFNLAAGEGVFLPDLCEKRKTNPYRAMLELMNGPATAAPDSDEGEADAPSPSNGSDETEADTPAPSSESTDETEEDGAPAPSSDSDEDEENAPTPSTHEEADAPAPADEDEDASAPASETEEEASSPSSDEPDIAPAPESGSDEGEEDAPAPSPTSESDESKEVDDDAPAPAPTSESDVGDEGDA